MSEQLSGSTALVTGATRGIGRAITTALLETGARVAGVYKQADAQAAELHAKYSEFLPIRFDLVNTDGIAGMVDNLPPPYDQIDILVNNAGIKHRVGFMETTPAVWEETMKVNLCAPYFLTQAVARGMAARRRGRIINITSQAAPNLSTDTLEYGLSNNGLAHLTKLTAKLLAPYQITVNAISPGRTDTDLAGYGADPAKEQRHLHSIPLGHINTPDEVASAALFLMSEASCNITGQIIAIDGGEVIR